MLKSSIQLVWHWALLRLPNHNMWRQKTGVQHNTPREIGKISDIIERKVFQKRKKTPDIVAEPFFSEDPATFKIIQMQDDGGGDAMKALRDEFPKLGALVDLIVQSRLSSDAAFGYQFQRSIMERGTFEVPSVTDNGTYRATTSVLLRDKAIIYGFDRNPNLLLVSSFLAEGFPISGIIIRSKRILINIGDKIWGVQLTHLQSLLQICDTYRVMTSACVSNAAPTLVTGDANFAHNAWNQLGALQNLAAISSSTSSLHILVTHEPLGSISELFPEVSFGHTEYCPDTYLEGHNGSNKIFVAPGGFRISTSLRSRIVTAAISSACAKRRSTISRLLDFHSPIFWLSIRTRNRTATNQTEALFVLCKAILASFPSAGIVIDGHSLPQDFEKNPSYDKKNDGVTVSADAAVAHEIIMSLKDANCISADQAVISAVGWSILESIALAQICDVYFCHHGTIQHKIGWFSNARGIVHSNKRTLKLYPAKWVAAQVEGGLEPTYIDESLVEDEYLAPALHDINESLRTECYYFSNIGALAELVVSFGRQVTERGAVRGITRSML